MDENFPHMIKKDNQYNQKTSKKSNKHKYSYLDI